jgi:hypothetical protein
MMGHGFAAEALVSALREQRAMQPPVLVGGFALSVAAPGLLCAVPLGWPADLGCMRRLLRVQVERGEFQEVQAAINGAGRACFLRRFPPAWRIEETEIDKAVTTVRELLVSADPRWPAGV